MSPFGLLGLVVGPVCTLAGTLSTSAGGEALPQAPVTGVAAADKHSAAPPSGSTQAPDVAAPMESDRVVTWRSPYGEDRSMPGGRKPYGFDIKTWQEILYQGGG